MITIHNIRLAINETFKVFFIILFTLIVMAIFATFLYKINPTHSQEEREFQQLSLEDKYKYIAQNSSNETVREIAFEKLKKLQGVWED